MKVNQGQGGPKNMSNLHSVRIHIDQKHYESRMPTTGEALYKLGNVAPGLVLTAK
jgi:hypothetical protein